MLKGEDRPRDSAEALSLAGVLKARARSAAAVRFYAEGLDADPGLAGISGASSRYGATCCAALAGSGQGKDDPKPDADARARLRTRALEWLKANFDVRAAALDAGMPQGPQAALRAVSLWKGAPELVGVREADALAKLPEAERKVWQAFWAEVDALLKRAKGKNP